MSKEKKTKSNTKLFVAGTRITQAERDVLKAYQQREGLSSFSDALRSIIIDRSGLFNGQAQQMNS